MRLGNLTHQCEAETGALALAAQAIERQEYDLPETTPGVRIVKGVGRGRAASSLPALSRLPFSSWCWSRAMRWSGPLSQP
jgi:hypothetical protein